MGRILRKIDTQLIPSDDRLCKKRMCIDLCENVHLHYRDGRIEFSIEEWRRFAKLIAEAAEGIEQKVKEGYVEGNHKMAGKWQTTLPFPSAYFPDRLQLEENANGSYHLHWNEMRLEMRPSTLAVFKRAIAKADKLGGDTIKLSKLLVTRWNVDRFEHVSLTDSAFYVSLRDNDRDRYTAYRTQLLKGNKRSCKTWEQFLALYEDIKNNGFNEDGYIELNSDGLTIGDGQHRASILLVLYPDLDVKIAKREKRPVAYPCIPHSDMQYKE